MKNKMILWTAGVIALVTALMIVIAILEPPREGITRAQAFKAAALMTASRKECEEREKEAGASHFSAKEQGNWFVKYMDYLYDEGYLSEELTPPDLATAQGLLTYREASFLAARAGKKFKAQVGAGKRNQDQPFPREEWQRLYEAMLKELDTEGKVREVTAVLYGTPSNLEDAKSWTAYTTGGDFGFEGLALDAYMDHEIRFLARDGEIAAILQVTEGEAAYENVWISSAEDGRFTAWLGSRSREFELADAAGRETELAGNLADLVMKDGALSRIVLKKDRIQGKVLSVTDSYIELEGYGRLELAPNFQVYKLYGEFARLEPKDILVGYDLQEFVAADGKLCAALVEREFDAKTIRVLLMDTDFKGIFHERADLTVHGPAVLEYEGDDGEIRTEEMKEGGELSVEPGDKRLAHGSLTVRPQAGGTVSIRSIKRAQGTPEYGGSLEIRQEEEGLVLVNDLYLEDYLTKVVPSEMPPSYEMEALKAQAVCARTYAYRQIQSNSYSQYGAHVDDSTNFQVYNNTNTNSRTDQAVKETYGRMLFWEGEAIEAFYFSTSCGHTTDGSVWGQGGEALPYLEAVELRDRRSTLDLTDNQAFDDFIRNKKVPSYDSAYPMYRWETDIPASLMEQKVEGVGQIQDMEVTLRGPGGIAKEITVTGSQGSASIKSQSSIRSTLGDAGLSIKKKDGTFMTGSASLPSAFISIEKRAGDEGEIVFHIYGGGFGHGAGMSQNGAQGMAKEGKTYQEILDFFYHGAQLEEQK